MPHGLSSLLPSRSERPSRVSWGPRPLGVLTRRSTFKTLSREVTYILCPHGYRPPRRPLSNFRSSESRSSSHSRTCAGYLRLMLTDDAPPSTEHVLIAEGARLTSERGRGASQVPLTPSLSTGDYGTCRFTNRKLEGAVLNMAA